MDSQGNVLIERVLSDFRVRGVDPFSSGMAIGQIIIAKLYLGAEQKKADEAILEILRALDAEKERLRAKEAA